MILESATLHKLLCDILNNTNVSVDETRWNNIEVRINKTLRALADEIEQKQVEAAPVAPSETPETDAVSITPLMAEACTPHKWDELVKLARHLERSTGLG